MKRISRKVTLAVLLLALALGALNLAFAEEAFNFAGSWQDEVSQRAVMDAAQEGNYVEIIVYWGGSATETASWEISGEFDPETGALIYEDARYTVAQWDEDGNETIVDEQTTCGSFTWEDGKLRWADELNAEEGLFEKLDEGAFETPERAPAPTADEFAEGYFAVLTGLEEGTAGASLKTAHAAAEVCAFAEDYNLYDPDVEPMRTNMLEAYDSMSEAEQEAFWTGFNAVRALLDDCLDDYEANRAAFEDAGVADAMDAIMDDPLSRLAWENLRDHTLTMGNKVL